MEARETSERDQGLIWAIALALLFFASCTATSCFRWANFEYRTFDLAYYVQAIWQLLHGRFQVSVEHVPLLGNHVEPIVLLFAPPFALFRHPMLFVVVQNAALATMAPVGFTLARRLGIERRSAIALAAALLLAPAAGYIALHEFHPEALTAPFLLLMLHARVARSLSRHWLWFAATLACKENMALLLAAYCMVSLFIERRRPLRELRGWYLWPLTVTVGWFLVFTLWITPALNAGDIDYLGLYSRLGNSATQIAMNAFRQPHLILGALKQSLTTGNLIWGLFLPFLALPLLRPRWLLVASPVFLQHLLSWRSSEWTIYFHYAAPLLPLLWIAMVEAIVHLQSRDLRLPRKISHAMPASVLFACVIAQAFLGPAPAIASTIANWPVTKPDHDRKNAFISAIPKNASVTAPLPYLSHLATREKLYSLHYILKGLKTLSRAVYDPPPPPDFVLIDYDDDATFDPLAGYYHPTMKSVDGRLIPSSDQLLHRFLKSCSWSATSRDGLTLLKRTNPVVTEAPASDYVVARFADGTELSDVSAMLEPSAGSGTLRVNLKWKFPLQRDSFPWMQLKLISKDRGDSLYVTRGLCAPEATEGSHSEAWLTDAPAHVAHGVYSLEAVFVDNAKRLWPQSDGSKDGKPAQMVPTIPLGELTVADSEVRFVPR